MKLSQLIELYKINIVPSRAESARAAELSRLKFLDQHLGHLSELSKGHIIDYVAARGINSVGRDLGVLHQVIEAGRLVWDVDFENPVPAAKAALSKLKRLTPDVKRSRRLSDAEFATLASDRCVGLLVRFAVSTAMRRGEIANMIPIRDLSGKILHIPKAKTGARTIPLSTVAQEILAVIPDGFQMKPDSMTQAFIRACRRNNIVGLRFHDLRHEATSRLFTKGLSIPEVALITGHADWKSLQRYTQLTPKSLLSRLD